jgi:hypothetical protein
MTNDPKASDDKPTTDAPANAPTDPASSPADTGQQTEVKPSSGGLLREDGGRLLREDGSALAREGGR